MLNDKIKQQSYGRTASILMATYWQRGQNPFQTCMHILPQNKHTIHHKRQGGEFQNESPRSEWVEKRMDNCHRTKMRWTDKGRRSQSSNLAGSSLRRTCQRSIFLSLFLRHSYQCFRHSPFAWIPSWQPPTREASTRRHGSINRWMAY